MSIATPTAESDDLTDSMWMCNLDGQMVKTYLLEHVAEFRKLSEIREKGWNNPQGDQYFAQQRQLANNLTEETSKFFHSLMSKIGQELQRRTQVFSVSKGVAGSGGQAMVLDMCLATGGFLEVALDHNPGARAVAFNLPSDNGGYEVRLRSELMSRIDARFLDITMLAADMGVEQIPPDHPEASMFLPRQLEPGQLFDLIFCNGAVVRGQSRAPYREPREARRLTSTRVVLGLEHMRPGGTMIVLLHKAEAWDTVCLLRRFSKFSSIQLFKPWSGHTKRSSFYMVATKVQSRKPEALEAIARWKTLWRAGTFGTDLEYLKVLRDPEIKGDQMLAEFGPTLVRLGKPVWSIQAQALDRAPFMKKK